MDALEMYEKFQSLDELDQRSLFVFLTRFYEKAEQPFDVAFSLFLDLDDADKRKV